MLPATINEHFIHCVVPHSFYFGPYLLKSLIRSKKSICQHADAVILTLWHHPTDRCCLPPFLLKRAANRRWIDKTIDLGGVVTAPGGQGELSLDVPWATPLPPVCQPVVLLNNCSKSSRRLTLCMETDSIQHHCSPFVTLTAIHSLCSVLQLLHTANHTKRRSRNRKCLCNAYYCEAECSESQS